MMNLNLLSPRQKEIVELISIGKTNREIAEILGLSHSTVRQHISAIYEHLGDLVDPRQMLKALWLRRNQR